MRINEIQKCRICGNNKIITVLDLGEQYLSGIFPKDEKHNPPRSPLILVKCDDSENKDFCGLLQLKHSFNADEMFGVEYGYRSGLNHTMTTHIQNIARKAEKIIGLVKGDVVLDIGSNDSTLLRGYESSDIIRVGIDPTIKHFLKYYPKDVKAVPDFFSSDKFFSTVNKKAKIITSIAMFYDLENPMAFAFDIRKVLDDNGIWIFEQSYMPTMLEMNSFDTVCHEHLEYYSLKQIEWILDKNDMKIIDIDFNEINGGSFRIYAAPKSSKYNINYKKLEDIRNKEKDLGLNSLKPYTEFRKRISRLKEDLTTFLKGEKQKGKKIYIYGASTKGNVLLQYFNIGKELITAAAERNPEKYGKTTPGTNIPIISEDEARSSKPDYFLVLPWHFKSEFVKREKEFIDGDGKLLFPLPKIEIIGKE